MNNLLKWQIISLISRLTAMAVGLFQTFFIIRILAPAEWGIIQIGMAIGGAFGIYQHLGLSSGSTREISTAEDDTDIFKIFITSVIIRYFVSVPVALFLFFSATRIAVGEYSQEVLILPIRIYALVLLIQGAKGIMNSVVAGTKRFKYLFLYQSGISVVSALIFIPLVFMYEITGYFYAFFLFELISAVILAFIAFKPLRGKLVFPNKDDFVRLFKQLFSILFAIYIVKILVTQWDKAGTLLLGRDVSPESVAIFSFAFLFAKKLMHISDAVTDVNLPVLSDSYVTNFEEFKTLFSENLNKIFTFMMFSAFSAVFWSRELVFIFVGNNPIYQSALPLVIPLIYTFIFFGLADILKSSIFIPAKFIKELLAGYFLMFAITVGGYFTFTRAFNYDYILVTTYAVTAGAIAGFLFLVISSQIRLQFKYVSLNHVLILIQAFFIMLTKDVESLLIKMPLFFVFGALFMAVVYSAGFLTKADLNALYSKTSRVFKR